MASLYFNSGEAVSELKRQANGDFMYAPACVSFKRQGTNTPCNHEVWHQIYQSCLNLGPEQCPMFKRRRSTLVLSGRECNDKVTAMALLAGILLLSNLSILLLVHYRSNSMMLLSYRVGKLYTKNCFIPSGWC